MIVSDMDALALLRKWFTERTPVRALAVSLDSTVSAKVEGFVNGLSSDILVSDGSLGPKQDDKNYIIFPAAEATDFSYLEAKDLIGFSPGERQRLSDKHGIANLNIHLKNGTRISIFEI